jgi:6-phosphogluconolactonase (cycloisomerase 2 family)
MCSASGPSGSWSPSPVVNPQPANTVPFAVTFDTAGHLVVADAGTNALSTFALDPDGTVSLLDAVGTGQSATCWVAPARGYLDASNAGSASVSGFQSAADGPLTPLGSPTSTDPGTVDASASAGGQCLHVQTGGKGIVDEFRIGADGSLLEIGHVLVAGAAGGEGIVAF